MCKLLKTETDVNCTQRQSSHLTVRTVWLTDVT